MNEITPEEFDKLAANLHKPESYAKKLKLAVGDQCLKIIPPFGAALMTGASEVRFSKTHVRVIYQDGEDETFPVTQEELENLNDNTSFISLISFVQNKRVI